MKDTARRKRMLVIRMSALGDVAMTISVVYSLATQYPELDVYMLTRPFFAKLFLNRPDNLHIIEADFKQEYKGAKGLMKLLKKLSGYRFDHVADLHNVIRSWVIDQYMWLRGKRVVMVSKMRLGRGELIRKRCNYQPQFISRYVAVLDALGFPVNLTFKSLFEHHKPALPFEIKSPAIGIAPFARYINKVYPAELMEQVINGLTEQGVNVYLFGARGAEAEQLDAWASKYPGAVSMAGRYSITDELAVMSRLSAMISMDSANQHLAALAGCKVITVWGSTTPACGFMPYRQAADLSICLDLKCQPCTIAGGNECPLTNFDCMRGITPQMIVDKAIQVIR